ncbi:hypothetical protein [Oceanibium sediminis]|uniref:hypothetical protein n=1 Tax=Oceanibium sediminis TaxID=2026339 RepID=UPI000DD31F35|nr:hypothetical protein [Oceanibium sediminis]
MKISLHLGAHKTASTYLQTALERNADLLAARRVGFVPLDDLRAEVTRRVWQRPGWDAERQAKAVRQAEAFLEPQLRRDDIDRLILSDENLIGTPGEIVLGGQLYPDVAARLGALPGLLAGHEVEIFLAVRPLINFTRSIYCESLRAPLPEFTEPEAFRAAWDRNAPDWGQVIRRIRGAFPDSPITLWSHAMVRSDAGALLNLLSGLEDSPGYDLEQIYRRPSLSQRATEALLEIGRGDGTRAMAEAATDLNRAHPLGEGNRQYMLWPRPRMRKDRLAWPDTYAALAGAAPGVRVLPLPSEDGAISR